LIVIGSVTNFEELFRTVVHCFKVTIHIYVPLANMSLSNINDFQPRCIYEPDQPPKYEQPLCLVT